MYIIIRPLLNARFAHNPSDWAGDRIICVGEYGIEGDLPLGVLTPCELVEYNLPEQLGASSYGEGWERAKILYYVPEVAVGWMRNDPEANRWDKDIRDDTLLRMFSTTAFTDLSEPTSSTPEPTSGILVVRNLTKRQYIRGDLIIATAGDPLFEMDKYLGEIAFFAMMWSNDHPYYDVPDEMEERLAHGCWAGDRIDLARVEKDVFGELGELAEWTDMTAAFVEIASAVLANNP